jgi:hypothetical protein
MDANQPHPDAIVGAVVIWSCGRAARMF